MKAPRRFFGVQPDNGLGMLEISLILSILEQHRGAVEGVSNALELDSNWPVAFIPVKAVASFITPGAGAPTDPAA